MTGLLGVVPHPADAIVKVTRPVRAHAEDGIRLGTGFWFGRDRPLLVTAAHVVEGAEVAGARAVLRHPDPEVDLAALVLDETPAAWFEASWIVDHDALVAIESVLVLGHPLGLADGDHPGPIVRSGVTATDPRLPWHRRAEFLVDVPCHPGTSGAPVVRYRPDDPVPFGLLGILVGGPALREDARTGVLADWPRGDTFHLGTAVDARRLLEWL